MKTDYINSAKTHPNFRYSDISYLTKRELETCHYLKLGYSAKQIGKLMSLSNRTIENYTDNIKKKLACHNKYALTALLNKNFKTTVFSKNLIWYNPLTKNNTKPDLLSRES